MKTRSKVISAIFVVFACLLVLPVLFFSTGSIRAWMNFVPTAAQEPLVFFVLEGDGDPGYKQVLLLEAWLEDLKANGHGFRLKNFERLLPITHSGGEALNEPIGLTAARIVIESKDCGAIRKMLSYYESDAQAFGEISRRLARSGYACPAGEAKN